MAKDMMLAKVTILADIQLLIYQSITLQLVTTSLTNALEFPISNLKTVKQRKIVDQYFAFLKNHIEQMQNTIDRIFEAIELYPTEFIKFENEIRNILTTFKNMLIFINTKITPNYPPSSAISATIKTDLPPTPTFSSSNFNLSFFNNVSKSFLIENRHKNDNLQHEYDKQYGVIVREQVDLTTKSNHR